MANANLILQYNFTDSNSLTFFDEQVSAFWDLDKSAKAIYQGEDKLMPLYEGGLKINNQKLEYSLKTPITVEGDFEFTLALDTADLGEVSLFKIDEAGSVVFTPAYTTISIDRANTTKIVYPTAIHQGGIVYITIGREGVDYTVVISTSQGTVKETAKGTDKSFDITSLFGGLMKLDGRLVSIEMFDGLTESTVESETQEVVEEIEEVIEEEETVEDMVEDAIEEAEETQEEVVEETEEEVVEETEDEITNPDKMTPFDKLLKAEVALLADYEGLAKAFNAGRSGSTMDAKTIQGYVEKNEAYIVKFIYYALLSIEELKKQDHTFLYQRAKYIAPMFGNPTEEEEEETKELEYGFKTDEEYNSFEFGKISNANLTNKMIVKLLMEEPEIWKPLLVKL